MRKLAKSVLKVLKKGGKVEKKWVSMGGKKIQIEEEWERGGEMLLIKVDESPGFAMKLPETMEVRDNWKRSGSAGTY